ncbi:hypothetical protein [Teichococcus aestuarii]|uniref:hypothetical protein n=1 Tax=Teichococcus aestuarii TaxID=568898 RepID=UPI0011B1F1E0|nr:hypothetical protein [Pseudoroseomonas aestuarii]
MSNTRPPPRPPHGDGEAEAPEGQRAAKQAQLTPETGAGGVAPRDPANAPSEPSPEPPSPGTSHEQDPDPKPLPEGAQRQLPDTQYGKAGPMNPPPETTKP